MEKQIKIVCLVALLLLVIVLPVAAIPTVIDQGVSTYDAADTPVSYTHLTLPTNREV